MSDDEIRAELQRLRERMDAIEALMHRPAAPPSRPLRLNGFAASEPVVLTVGHPASEVEQPTGLTEAADGGGTVVFNLALVKLAPVPPPDARLWRARGERSGRVSEAAVRTSTGG